MLKKLKWKSFDKERKENLENGRDISTEKYIGKIDFCQLVNETILAYPEPFFDMFGMSPCNLEEGLNILGLDLIKPNAHRDPIGPGKSLAVFVRCLSTGDAFTTIAQSYRIRMQVHRMYGEKGMQNIVG